MSEHTLNPPNVKRLERSQTDKILAGVSGGLGRYFDLSPAVFRLGFIALTLLGGAGFLVYIAAALVMPKEGEERSTAEDILANRRDHPARLVALALVAVAVLSLLAHADTWPTAGTAWFLVALAALIFLWTGRRRGLAIALFSFLALMVVIAVAAVTAAFAWFDVSLGDGVGDRTYTPTTAATTSHHLGLGKLTLDLTEAPRGAHVNATVGIGELRVIVPRGRNATLDARVKAGSIDALGRHDSGSHAHLVLPGGDALTVDARVGAGHIEVVRAP
ncbi:MAG TPA: PspC domain-containing protein [Gaiellaceae bacterium]|nr:PspC domain-containing protein [Gaiellaceae bacterium]